ncbi:MAG: hypothetical protein KDE25_02990 [Novosphingobium sp.]|nr:hypothetical protein [Novosphingobium sp.]
MPSDYTLIFLVLLVVVIGFFPALDAVRMWRMAKHHDVEQRQRIKRDRRFWRRQFLWRVFSTKRVPRLTDQSEARMHRQR